MGEGGGDPAGNVDERKSKGVVHAELRKLSSMIEERAMGNNRWNVLNREARTYQSGGLKERGAVEGRGVRLTAPNSTLIISKDENIRKR